jgi:hypothetical protein
VLTALFLPAGLASNKHLLVTSDDLPEYKNVAMHYIVYIFVSDLPFISAKLQIA